MRLSFDGPLLGSLRGVCTRSRGERSSLRGLLEPLHRPVASLTAEAPEMLGPVFARRVVVRDLNRPLGQPGLGAEFFDSQRNLSGELPLPPAFQHTHSFRVRLHHRQNTVCERRVLPAEMLKQPRAVRRDPCLNTIPNLRPKLVSGPLEVRHTIPLKRGVSVLKQGEHVAFKEPVRCLHQFVRPAFGAGGATAFPYFNSHRNSTPIGNT